MTVTARAGLDDALESVPVYSLGSASPYLPCTHVHTDDLRGSLSLLTAALSGTGRPTRVRVSEAVPRTELRPPAYDGPGDPVPRRDVGDRPGAARRGGHRRRRGQHRCVGDSPPAGAPRRTVRRRARDGRDGVQLRRRRRHGVRAARPPDGRHRGRRLVLHARHGDSHRGAIPTADHFPALRQPCACDVRDARTAVLRRSVQLQPVRAEPAGRRAWRDVPRTARRSTSTISTGCRPR